MTQPPRAFQQESGPPKTKKVIQESCKRQGREPTQLWRLKITKTRWWSRRPPPPASVWPQHRQGHHGAAKKKIQQSAAEESCSRQTKIGKSQKRETPEPNVVFQKSQNRLQMPRNLCRSQPKGHQTSHDVRDLPQPHQDAKTGHSKHPKVQDSAYKSY